MIITARKPTNREKREKTLSLKQSQLLWFAFSHSCLVNKNDERKFPLKAVYYLLKISVPVNLEEKHGTTVDRLRVIIFISSDTHRHSIKIATIAIILRKSKFTQPSQLVVFVRVNQKQAGRKKKEIISFMTFFHYFSRQDTCFYSSLLKKGTDGKREGSVWGINFEPEKRIMNS